MLRCVVALASGLLLAAAFPNLGIWPLTPVALAGLLLAHHSTSIRLGVALSWLFALAFFFVHINWAGTYVGPVPLTALVLLQSAFFLPLGAVLSFLMSQSQRRPSLLWWGFPALWVATEALRSRIPFGGFGWGRLAFAQADAPTMYLAWLVGTPAVSAVLAVVAVSIYHLAVRRQVQLSVGAIVTVAFLTAACQFAVTNRSDTERTLNVAGIQGNVPRAGLEFNAQRRAVLTNHAQVTTQLAQQITNGTLEPASVVIWPENASDINPLSDKKAYDLISSSADAVNAPIVVGTITHDDQQRPLNTSIVWWPQSDPHHDAGPGESYIKRRPAPFGEYIPLRSIARQFSPLVDRVVDFQAGTDVVTFTVDDVSLGPLICFEVVIDDVVADVVRAGAQVIVVQTNNATFGYTAESAQQLAMSKIRAVEYGRAVAHVSTVGISAMVQPSGHVLESTELFTPAVLSSRLDVRSQHTPAYYLGQPLEWLLTALTPAALFVALRNRSTTTREKNSQSDISALTYRHHRLQNSQ